MKTKLHSAICILPSSFALLAAITLCLTALPARAQGDTVTISAAEFQRMVYSAHLHTQLAEKSELDPCLQVLLELQRRNPWADPVALTGILTNALHRYRASAPAHIRANGFRDEIFAAYLDALRQVPGRTNLMPANLPLLNNFMLGAANYSPNLTPAQLFDPLIDSGNQRLFSSEGEAIKRQAVVDNCVARARANPAFANALDRLLLPETLVSLRDSPSDILGNTNSPLHDNPTMQTLLALSAGSSDGSLTVSSNQLMNLFTTETETLWDTIHTNLALRAEINQRQPDLLAYLTNQVALNADAERLAAIKQDQARTIASSTAAILVQSQLQEARAPMFSLPKEMKAVGSIMSTIATGLNIMGNDKAKGLTKALASGNLIMAGLQVFSFLTGGESPEEQTAREIANIKTLIGDLSTNMNYRFDRVDQSLTTIFNTLNAQFDKIIIIEGKIDHINGSVDDIRRSLVDVQAGLDRLERELFTDWNYSQRSALDIEMNGALFYELRNPNSGPMSWATYSQIPDGPENYFLTYATSMAAGDFSSPWHFASDQLAGSALAQQLSLRPLDANLNYIYEFLSTTLGQATARNDRLANPRDWFAGAYAYLQLALENPMCYRYKGLTMPAISNVGTNLSDFFRSLTFTGTNINWPLYAALEDFYLGKLINFTDQVRSTEQQYAVEHHIPSLESWRQWGLAAPRVAAASTVLLESHRERPVVPPELIPLGSQAVTGIIALGGDQNGSHGLVLQTGGTVAAWGENDYGQSTVPAGLSNVVAVAAGIAHSLALREDGTVIAWGGNTYNMATVPVMATNVAAIRAGSYYHNLAVRADGRVVGWGYNGDGQATGVPSTNSYPYSEGLVELAHQTLTNVIAAGGGFYHSLALRSNGTVVAWGKNDSGQTNVPAGLAEVMAIAAGGWHNLALRSNGTVVAWGNNNEGQTNVPSGLTSVVAVAAGSHHSLALRTDGTVAAWGYGYYGQTNVPAGLSNVVAIAADQLNSLALRRDGTLVAWGLNDWLWEGPVPVPQGLSNVVAVAAGSQHCLALRADGSLTAWGDNQYGQATIPAGLSNVTAVAAGDYHSLALKADGKVVAWGTGYWNYGQTNVPADLTDAVAISAGAEYSVALRRDGRVVPWGRALQNAPANLTNVLAVAAARYHCLALTVDRRVQAWGENYWGQCNVPSSATNVVAIDAGSLHNLALRSDGTVVAWGNNTSGECNVPSGLSNVVAIASGSSHSVALKSDGTVVAWGYNSSGQCNVPGEATNVVAIDAGYQLSLYLQCSGASNGSSLLNLVRGPLPTRVRNHLWDLNELVLTNLDLELHDAGIEVSGGKSLLQAVLELGMPYTLERDDVLQGFLYGSESLVDLAASRAFLEAENTMRQTLPDSIPQAVANVAVPRYLGFANRLNQCLTNLAVTGQPEIPRLVGHTMRLLNLLRDAYAAVPPPALEVSSANASPRLLLYGEPYAHYTLQYRDALNAPAWSSTTLTNLLQAQPITNLPPFSASPQRFYRAMLPMP